MRGDGRSRRRRLAFLRRHPPLSTADERFTGRVALHSEIARTRVRRNDVKRTFVTALIGAVALGVSTSAHHSFAAHYLEDQTVSLEGEIAELEYRSPHSWVHVHARDE